MGDRRYRASVQVQRYRRAIDRTLHSDSGKSLEIVIVAKTRARNRHDTGRTAQRIASMTDFSQIPPWAYPAVGALLMLGLAAWAVVIWNKRRALQKIEQTIDS